MPRHPIAPLTDAARRETRDAFAQLSERVLASLDQLDDDVPLTPQMIDRVRRSLRTELIAFYDDELLALIERNVGRAAEDGFDG